MNIEIRRADGSAASELTAVAFAAKRHWGYPEAWIDLWADELTVDREYVEENWVFLAKSGARTLGWCAVSEERGEYWLDYCWVLPEATNRGIGRALVLQAFSLATELNSRSLKVIADPNAEAFYAKLGFRRIGDHPSVPSGRRLPILEAYVANAVMSKLFWKATLAFVAFPGMVAFAVPLLLFGPNWPQSPVWAVGLVPLIAGTFLLLGCVREFYVAGRGTLAPWTPPQSLVVSGLYRFSRNPMYVAVVSILIGWAVVFRSWPLGIYALIVAVGFHLRVVFGEEPWLARTFGEAWTRYKAHVPRWLGFSNPG